MKKLLEASNNHKVIVIGPYPPPYGGVATFIKNLMNQDAISRYYNLKLYETGKKSKKVPTIIQAIIEIYLIIKYFSLSEFKNINIFHIHTASYWSFLRNIPYILISKHFSDGKVILHIHGGNFHIFFKKSPAIIKKIIKLSFKNSDCIIVTSPVWITIIKKICTECNHIYSISNGFDPEIIYPIPKERARELLNLPKDKKILLSIGHLEDFKGHKYLLESLKNIGKDRSNIAAYIIGTGSLKENLNRLIGEFKLEKVCFLAGEKDHSNEIPLWINACDIFVLPSLAEGNPTVMFECLGCGKPFIGTKVGGIPDIITSEEYGFLVEPANSKDLTEKIITALDKEWNNKKILEYSQQFTWENIANQILKIYRTSL
ncbi:N-acetyl-alpha-D-glucosaminyl L-malate synthase [Methanosarcinales archaeon]|nr:N-acetyl-alpha-D-glucosaminyl L-malate synthase [Methanosarcinales archaeon]